MSGGGAGGGKGAAATGPVPEASRRLVQSLKEIVNRPDAEIYAALRECGMDPDEAVSRLLSQDTFQEVKSKRDKKKEVKETPEPRSRVASNATSRGVRGGADRVGRNNTIHSSSIDNAASRSSVSGSGMASTNSTQKPMVPISSVNKNMVAEGPSVPLQPSSGFQHGWSGMPGQLSMADIVKMGMPQGKPSSKPVVTADKGYAGQCPSLPSTVNHNWKQSVSIVPPTELDQGLPSVQDSTVVKDHSNSAYDNKQTYDNDWSPQDKPPSGNQSSLPETSGDPSLYEAPLHSSTLVADVVNSHENSHLDENSSTAIRSVDASERHLEYHEGNPEYNDGLLQNSSTYLPQKHSHTEDEENIIAMHFPADDLSSGLLGYFEGFYRNHMQEVIRFFEMHYKAYCTIDGIPVDVLIIGAAQNRAVEGDLVAITVDPVVYWTRMKGPNIACNPVIGGDAVVREVSETNGNHSLKKGQTDASCRFENSSNGLPVLDRMHYHHKNSGFSQAVKCENGHATVPESYEKDLEGKTEAARALQRICSMIYSHPSRRPTG